MRRSSRWWKGFGTKCIAVGCSTMVTGRGVTGMCQVCCASFNMTKFHAGKTKDERSEWVRERHRKMKPELKEKLRERGRNSIHNANRQECKPAKIAGARKGGKVVGHSRGNRERFIARLASWPDEKRLTVCSMGGKAAMAKLTAAERSERAAEASRRRWGKRCDESQRSE